MEIHVRADDTLALDDAENFRAFKLVVDHPKSALGHVRHVLADMALLPDEETAWVSEMALRRWPGHVDDPLWQRRLGEMIDKVKPHGWIDEVNQAIKAHIDWRG
jgi:hypothetical protein